MSEPKRVELFPAGIVTPPPSKSYGHRALICAALAALSGGERSILYNLGESEDMDATITALRALGAGCERRKNAAVIFRSETASNEINCGESGSTLRFMLPVAAALSHTAAFTGRGRLMERPLGAYEDIFPRGGVSLTKEDNRVRISGRLSGGRYALSGSVSSQFVTGLLLAAPLTGEDVSIALTSPLESSAYVDITIEVMASFGVAVKRTPESFTVAGGQAYRAAEYTVEADFSQAAFFLAAAALGCGVSCAGLNRGSLQGDRAILRVLHDMGAEVHDDGGVISVRAERLHAATVDMREIPDLAPPIAAMMCFAEGESRMINAGRLRFKESDRLNALAEELHKLGADICEEADGLVIRGSKTLPGGRADSRIDHRITMMLAVAASRCTEPVLITGADAVNKSYPKFWEDFEKTPDKPCSKR